MKSEQRTSKLLAMPLLDSHTAVGGLLGAVRAAVLYGYVRR